MTNEVTSNLVHPDFEFPPSNIPTIFCDGIMNCAPANGIVRFYLFRFDPGIGEEANEKIKVQPVAQLIMPLDGFINTAEFMSTCIADIQKKSADKGLAREVAE